MRALGQVEGHGQRVPQGGLIATSPSLDRNGAGLGRPGLACPRGAPLRLIAPLTPRLDQDTSWRARSSSTLSQSRPTRRCCSQLPRIPARSCDGAPPRRPALLHAPRRAERTAHPAQEGDAAAQSGAGGGAWAPKAAVDPWSSYSSLPGRDRDPYSVAPPPRGAPAPRPRRAARRRPARAARRRRGAPTLVQYRASAPPPTTRRRPLPPAAPPLRRRPLPFFLVLCRRRATGALRRARQQALLNVSYAAGLRERDSVPPAPPRAALLRTGRQRGARRRARGGRVTARGAECR